MQIQRIGTAYSEDSYTYTNPSPPPPPSQISPPLSLQYPRPTSTISDHLWVDPMPESHFWAPCNRQLNFGRECLIHDYSKNARCKCLIRHRKTCSCCSVEQFSAKRFEQRSSLLDCSLLQSSKWVVESVHRGECVCLYLRVSVAFVCCNLSCVIHWHIYLVNRKSRATSGSSGFRKKNFK